MVQLAGMQDFKHIGQSVAMSEIAVYRVTTKNKTRLGLQCQTPLRYHPLSLIPYPLRMEFDKMSISVCKHPVYENLLI